MRNIELLLRLLLLMLNLGACASLPDSTDPVANIQLVETFPAETELGTAGLVKAEAQWMDMISRARRTIDISQFYVQTIPHSSLDRVLKSLEAAGARGIQIRFLIDEAFVKKYPNDTGKTVESIKKWPKTEVRMTNRWTKAGGIQHAKYFIIDGQDAFLGSQNFDWRALDHIKELGFRFRSPPLVASLQAVFNDDWDKALNQEAIQELDPKFFQPAIWRDQLGQLNKVALKLSPNPDANRPGLWDFPDILQMIQESKSKIRLTAMMYRPIWGDKRAWLEMETALMDAQKRGVKVQFMVDNRNRPKEFKALIEAGVEVGFVKIPQHSSGQIPYARLIHAKYMVVDDQKAWLGTSNLEADHFYYCRNVSLIIDSPKLATDMASVFDRYWSSPYLALLRLESSSKLKAREEP